MENCLFCKIASKEINSAVVYEDESTLAFLDIHPCAPGHTMVIPKVHAGNIVDLSDELVGPLFITVKKVTALLNDKLGGKGFTLPNSQGNLGGFTIGINQGIMAGQAIDHLHIHIIPRYAGDGGGSLHSVVHFAGKESVEEIAKRINNN